MFLALINDKIKWDSSGINRVRKRIKFHQILNIFKMVKNIKMFVTFQVIILLINLIKVKAVTWTGDWAFACDFKGNDLSNVRVSGDQCGSKCASTSGCTHFTYTTYNDGTCWMKQGPVSKSNAFDTGDKTMVCGVVSGKTIFIIFNPTNIPPN